MDYLKDNPDVNIIGIDRGERHLIYLTLINQRGEIVKQKTFNTVNQFNYQEKLTQRENERDEARKSWASIGKIKDLKELAYQTDRMQRRADIQKEQIERDVEVMENEVRGMITAVENAVEPVRATIMSYTQTAQTVWKILSTLFFKKK